MGVSSTLTLLFEDPFWIGLYERTDFYIKLYKAIMPILLLD